MTERLHSMKELCTMYMYTLQRDVHVPFYTVRNEIYIMYTYTVGQVIGTFP